MKVGIIAMYVMFAIFQLMTRPGESVVTCSQVITAVEPCMGYLIHGGDPSVECCSGVKVLVSLCQSIIDKQEACRCVKAAAAAHPTINEAYAALLADKCGVKLDVIVSHATDCNSIH